MLTNTHQQIADFGLGIAGADIFVGASVVGTITSTRQGSSAVFHENIGSNTLAALPDTFRLAVSFGSGPASPQTTKVTTVDTWDLNADPDDVAYPSTITKYREIRFSATGAVKAIWLEGSTTSGTRPVVYFGEAWDTESTLFISTRTDLTTSAARAAEADEFKATLDDPCTYVTSVWTIL